MGPAILDQYHDDFAMEVKASRSFSADLSPFFPFLSSLSLQFSCASSPGPRSAWALTVRFFEPTSSRITCYPPLLVEWARDGPLPTVHCLLFKFQYFRQATGYTIEDAVSESYRKLRADADWWFSNRRKLSRSLLLQLLVKRRKKRRRRKRKGQEGNVRL
jgi:hypothetical protein